jgi:hypothetical protein
MNVIETTAPISIEELKQFFANKETLYNIDYYNSKLQGKKLLTYLSNLDIPSDINLNSCDRETKFQLAKDYMEFQMMVNVPSLELMIIEIIEERKGIFNHGYEDFIESNIELIDSWILKIDSLTVYNMYIINSQECQEFAQSFENCDTDELSGVNFVSLIKRQEFYSLFERIDTEKLKFYTKYFNDYMFKGNNLYSYWANENNPLFLLTYSISEGIVDGNTYNLAKQQTVKELSNGTPVQ